MLAWVVIYRRHLQHSAPMPSSLCALRLCVQLSTSQRSNLPLRAPFLFTSLPPHFLTSRSPYPPAPIKDPDPVGTPSWLLATDGLSLLAATLMDLPASVPNKRLTAWLNPLDATLTKNRGWGQSGAIFRPTDQLSTQPSSSPKSLPYNPFADPHPLSLYPAIFYKKGGGKSAVLPPVISHGSRVTVPHK